VGSLNATNLAKEPNYGAKKFFGLLKDLEQPTYSGSRCSKLSALLKLLHIKSMAIGVMNHLLCCWSFLKMRCCTRCL